MGKRDQVIEYPTRSSQVELVKSEDSESGDENEERGNWGSKLEFLLSCTGYAVGLGNVWRFPYLCYRNGGGAFLIPYVIMLAFAGLPLFFLEVSFGQYCSLGPISCWRAVPMFRGVGYGMLIVSAYVGIYYNVIIMYTLYYMFASFTSVLPWVGCGREWNTRFCSDIVRDCLNNRGIVTFNNTCVKLSSLTTDELESYNITRNYGGYNLSLYTDPFLKSRKPASEEYWKLQVLKEADSIGEPGEIQWQLALCLLLAWIIIFLCLFKGVKSSGKVVYFTATFPYVVLVILLVRGVTLEGYFDGVLFFITPRWETLSNPQVWLDAAVQIFYSLSAAWGGLITLASYNKFHNNCYFDSVLVATLNCATSIFAGFVIFSIMGFMANELNREVGDVVDEGFGLAFIAYPEAVARLPVSPLWAILFFVMLLTLGLDSQFTIMETVVTAIVDELPQLRKKKTFVMLAACGLGYLLGFTCITRAGPYWVELMDSYGASFSLLIYGLCECIAISWLYGIKRFKNDIRTMIGDSWVDFPTFVWWPLNWCAITPALLSFVLMFNWMNWSEPSYNGPYPAWAHAIGWMMILSSLIWIPIIINYEFIRTPGSLSERWQAMSNPREVWGPALGKFRLEASQVHKEHGTTFGGRLANQTADLNGRKNDLGAKMPAVIFTPGMANEGFDPPL
ncbi:sodium- and chloride-dependent glycine transporter 1-like [Acanthaster planci]|uniref:Transporter n=1 Tax=Acanthaster planci TaxID=133434 RepID=A0A8B7Z0L3_ACAPL|nr:sodium- and chloride-dependent glycine transporter 1-like [Acanthaster planci]